MRTLKKLDSKALKELSGNEVKVYLMVQREKLGKRYGLSLATVDKILNKLIERGYISE